MKKVVGKPSVIKTVNTNYIKQLILQNKKITKPEIARLTNLSLTTVNKIVDNLLATHEVEALDYSISTGGRRALYYALNKSYQSILSIFVQENIYYACIYNSLGQIIISKTIYHQDDISWTEELQIIIDQFLENKEYNIVCIGVGVPGIVNNNIISNIPSIVEWTNINLHDKLQQRYDPIIIIENDINCAAIGIHKDISTSSNMTFFLHIQHGIKSSIIIDKNLYKSKLNFSGELSYMKLDINQKENLETLIRQFITLKQYDKLVTYISSIILNTICILEPSLIIIESIYLYDGIVDDLMKVLLQQIESQYIPEILLVNTKETYYHQGLFKICFDRMRDKTVILKEQ